MKSLLFLVAVSSITMIPLFASDSPPILNSAGVKLENPEIKSFDGATFEVIHSGGVSRVPWDRMPEVYRKGYAFDPARAAREPARQHQQEILDAKETQRRENTIIKDQLALQQRSGVKGVQTTNNSSGVNFQRIERVVPMLNQVNLAQFGGPKIVVAFQQINPLEIQYRVRRGNWQTVPLKAGVGDQLTLLFQDGSGCKTFFLDRTSRNQNEAILVFERPVAPHPKSSVGPGGHTS